MKKLKWLILVMCLVLGLSVFVACGGNDDNKGDNNKVEVTGVSLQAARSMEVGQTVYLNAVITPNDAEVETATWTSSKPDVLTVADDGVRNGFAVGKLVGVGAGEATVTVNVGGKTATCTVTVTEHLVPYYFIAGQSGAAYFNWDDNVYREILDTEEARIMKPDSTEKVFTATIDLFEGDMFKFCKLTEASTDNKWDNQVGANNTDEGVNITVAGETEKTVLDTSTDGGSGNFNVTVEGKYEITLDMSGSNPELSYKKVGPTDPVAWSYNVGFHGSWGNVDNEAGDGKVWNTINFGTATFDKDHLTATADIELQEAEGFGIKTMKNGAQVGWFNSDVIELADGVTGITKNAGANATCTATGTYNVTVTFNADGQITKVLFNTFTAAAAE